MTEPLYSDPVERVYSRLPEFYRTADAEDENAYALKRWIAGMLYGHESLSVLVERLRLTGDLADPDLADPEWLPWLAKIVGVKLNSANSVSLQREQIKGLQTGLRAGSRASVIAAVQTVLTGTKFVEIRDHTTDTSTYGAAGEWDVAIITALAESPSGATILAAVAAAGVKPAGITLYARSDRASWASLAADRPMWDDWLVTWAILAVSGSTAYQPASQMSSLGYVGAAYGGEVF